MKKLIVTGIILVLLIVAGVSTWQHFRDVRLRHAVVGNWRGTGGSRFSLTIAPDGSESWGTPRPDAYSGTWQISHGILILTTTNTTVHGGSSLIGGHLRLRVVHLSDHYFVYRMDTKTYALTK